MASSTNTNGEVDTSILPFKFDYAYKGDEIKQQVIKILGLSKATGWSIVDKVDNLVMVHYDDGADLTDIDFLRGVVVDIANNRYVASSYGYTPTAVVDELKVDDSGHFEITDEDNKVHKFPVNDTIVKPVFEGVVLRIIWYEGKCYKLTHKRINTERSRWGSSIYFVKMYEEAGGPTPEQLFDLSVSTSSSCYSFLVVHSDLCVATRQMVNKPYLVYLGEEITNYGENSVRGIWNAPAPSSAIDAIVNTSFIHNPAELSVEDANKHLHSGYYSEFEVSDKRMSTGEGLLVCRKSLSGDIIDIVKVHSTSFDWRFKMRGNNPNTKHQFFSLLNTVYPDVEDEAAWNKMKERYILMPNYDEASISSFYEENKAILFIPVEGEIGKANFKDRESRIYLLWLNFVLSLPANKQGEALDYIRSFKQDRDNVIAWLQNFEQTYKELNAVELSPRAKNIITAARTLSKDRIATGNNYSQTGGFIKYPLLIKNTIKNLIYKENGTSLYALIREMKKPKTTE